jgi:hypothetical protein
MENTRNAVVRWGVLFGLIMALLGSAASIGARLLTGSLISSGPLALRNVTLAALLTGCALDLVYLALFFVAGILTARQTGSVGSGALAGLFAGGVGALLSGVVSVTLAVVFPRTFSDYVEIQTTVTAALASIVIGSVVGLVIWSGLGAGLGALGALIGQSQFRAAHPELAQPRPYPGYPPAPPLGAYPPPPPGASASPLGETSPAAPTAEQPPGPVPPYPPRQ